MVDRRGARNQDAGADRRAAERREQVMRAENVAGEGLVRMSPRVADVRHAGQVIDRRRPRACDRRLDRFALVQLDVDPLDARAADDRLRARAEPADDLGRVVLEQLDQVAADEARRAGDQDGDVISRRLPYCASYVGLEAGSRSLIGRHHHSFCGTRRRWPRGRLERHLRLPADARAAWRVERSSGDRGPGDRRPA